MDAGATRFLSYELTNVFSRLLAHDALDLHSAPGWRAPSRWPYPWNHALHLTSQNPVTRPE